jgi:hypothetical protein
MEFYVTCPFCGEHVYGVNTGDIINNLRIHFDECAKAEDYQ